MLTWTSFYSLLLTHQLDIFYLMLENIFIFDYTLSACSANSYSIKIAYIFWSYFQKHWNACDVYIILEMNCKKEGCCFTSKHVNIFFFLKPELTCVVISLEQISLGVNCRSKIRLQNLRNFYRHSLINVTYFMLCHIKTRKANFLE